MNADSIKIESEERGFELHVETDEGDRFAFNIHSCAEALHEQVNLIIGEWLAEGQAARRAYAAGLGASEWRAFMCNPDESGGYDTSDPKHPEFHSVHADLYDDREKV